MTAAIAEYDAKMRCEDQDAEDDFAKRLKTATAAAEEGVRPVLRTWRNRRIAHRSRDNWKVPGFSTTDIGRAIDGIHEPLRIVDEERLGGSMDLQIYKNLKIPATPHNGAAALASFTRYVHMHVTAMDAWLRRAAEIPDDAGPTEELEILVGRLMPGKTPWDEENSPPREFFQMARNVADMTAKAAKLNNRE